MDAAQSNPRRSVLFRISDRAMGLVIHLALLVLLLQWFGLAVYGAIQAGHWTSRLTIACLVAPGNTWSALSYLRRGPSERRKARSTLEQLLRLLGTAVFVYAAVLLVLGMLEESIPETLWKPLVLVTPPLVLLIPYALRRSEAAESALTSRGEPSEHQRTRSTLEQILQLLGTAVLVYAVVLLELWMLEVSIPEVLWKPLVLMLPVLALFIPYWLRRSEAAEREAAEATSSRRATRGRVLWIAILVVLGLSALTLVGREFLRSPAVAALEVDEALRADDVHADRLEPSSETWVDAPPVESDVTANDFPEEPQVALEVEYDPSPRGALFDREGHRAYLALIYAETELADLEHTAWEVMQYSNTLSAQAFKDQRAKGLCNAAVSTDGYTPKRLLERRPDCRYQLQSSTERADVPGAEVALKHIEYYVREDEYPEVFRASEELRWLGERIRMLGGRAPTAR